MDKGPKAFLEIKRGKTRYRPARERARDYKEIVFPRPDKKTKEQACRCMDCGTPFCHWACPLGNYIPEWNDLVSGGQWREALQLLEAANNLPEITGRVCPALCEYSCVLDINDGAVTIRENELAIIEYGFNNGFIKPVLPKKRTGKKVAVIGSGPAGLSAAAELNRAGHSVVVFERDDKIGGILRYGIPDFKLEKHLIDRRIGIWKREGVVFKTKVDVGNIYPAAKLRKNFNAVCLAIGSRQPRDLKIPGRELRGIYFAMDFLIQANKKAADKRNLHKEVINAKGKCVVIIGGGDTGADCLGVALRQGAKSVIQIELMAKPAECRTDSYPWPEYPLLLKMSTSHQEGGKRCWEVLTKKFLGKNGKVKRISCVKVKNEKEISHSEFEIKADIVILAMGFIHPPHKGVVKELKLNLDKQGNIKADSTYMTSVKGVFVAGDAHRGQSLVVWAIDEGRKAAGAIGKWLMG